MAYATLAELQLRISESELIRLTDEPDAGAIDEAKIEAALEAASIEIDSYLAARYPLPLPLPQPLLQPICVDLAVWNLYAIVEHAGVPEVRRERYDQAVAALKRMASGAQTLGIAPQEVGSEAAVFAGPPRLFNRNTQWGR